MGRCSFHPLSVGHSIVVHILRNDGRYGNRLISAPTPVVVNTFEDEGRCSLVRECLLGVDALRNVVDAADRLLRFCRKWL